ncbi:MAG: hypothetical protein WDZ51_18450 [Pirellulaceae bacterium]
MKSNPLKLTPWIGAICLIAVVAFWAVRRGGNGDQGPENRLGYTVSPDSTASTDIDADHLLEQVVQQLEERQSVSAEIRFQTTMLGQLVTGKGGYQQLGAGAARMYRLWLDGSEEGSPMWMSQSVSDQGQFLWSQSELPLGKVFQVVDLDKVRHAIRQTASTGSAGTRPGNTGQGSGGLMPTPLGALSEVIENLCGQFEFAPVEELALADNRFWVVRGQLSTERLKKLLPEEVDSIDAGSFDRWHLLPENQPHTLILLIGAESLFPHRLMLQRYGQEKHEGTTRVTPPRSFMLVDLHDVQLDGSIDPRHFEPLADRKDALDVTQKYLERYAVAKH